MLFLEKQQKKPEILVNKPVYLGYSVLKLRNMLMYEFWYDYVKPKYGKRAKLCYIDTNQNISLYTQKQMIITNILQKMLKQDLTLQIMY